MKKLLNHVICLVAVLVCFGIVATSCGEPKRQEVLKIYNWGDYIDEDLLEEFEEWYAEQTGCEVTIIYQTFDINEVMLAKIEKGEADFDVVCPSEYIIERMMRNNLLQPIVDEEFIADLERTGTENYLDCVSPYLKRQFDHIITPSPELNANDYSVGYMWGTTGILFNTENVTAEEASSWDLLFDERLEGKILIKDAFRDVYSPMLVYAMTVELREQGVLGADETLPLNVAVAAERNLDEAIPTIEGLMYDATDGSIAHVEEYLKRMKQLVAGWEADFGKEMMTQNKAWINLMWSGDAVWAIEEAAEVGVSLDYRVPEEGSNVWFDGWVIPKYAVNTKAASYFINFMCRSDIAIRNMDEIGYVSVIATPEVLESRIDEELESSVDASYFFGKGAENVKIDPVQYPDKAVVERCGMMHDSGDRTPKLLEMWARVKSNDVPLWIWIVIALSFSTLAFLYIRRKIVTSRKKSHRAQRKGTTKRK